MYDPDFQAEFPGEQYQFEGGVVDRTELRLIVYLGATHGGYSMQFIADDENPGQFIDSDGWVAAIQAKRGPDQDAAAARIRIQVIQHGKQARRQAQEQAWQLAREQADAAAKLQALQGGWVVSDYPVRPNGKSAPSAGARKPARKRGHKTKSEAADKTETAGAGEKAGEKTLQAKPRQPKNAFNGPLTWYPDGVRPRRLPSPPTVS